MALLLLASANSVLAQPGGRRQADDAAAGAIDWTVCSTCHSDKGLGPHKPPMLAPCLTCHIDTGTGTPGKHLDFEKAGRPTCERCHNIKPKEGENAHVPAAYMSCMTCHDPHSDGKSPYLKANPKDLCTTCHPAVDDAKQVHTALKLGLCTTCHDAHASPNRKLLKSSNVGDLCVECHASYKRPYDVGHMPASAGMCTNCHGPHGSDQPKNLLRPAPELCAMCHSAKDNKPVVHSAVKLAECGGCHDPHGSPNPSKLRGETVGQTCFECHSDDIAGRAVVHSPIAQGECATCHDPHSAPWQKNLRSDANLTCTMCHPDKDRTELKTPHPAVTAYGCTVCHDPHASAYKNRLRKPLNDLCTSCHAGFDDGFHIITGATGMGHPTDTRRDPRFDDVELSCASCHDPHGTDNKAMWYSAGKREDLCNECHGQPRAARGSSSSGRAASNATEGSGTSAGHGGDTPAATASGGQE